jgi:hypothetical protein
LLSCFPPCLMVAFADLDVGLSKKHAQSSEL